MATIKLYYAPKTRSTRPRWALEEMGLPYEMVRISLAEKQHKTDAYKKVHPLGKVPAMEINGQVIFESSAMLGYLADLFPEKKMAPAVGEPERPLYWQWMMFGVATLEAPILNYFYHSVMNAPEKRLPSVVEDSVSAFRSAAGVLEQVLTDRDYLLGKNFCMADILVGSLLGFAKALKMPLADFPAVAAYTERVTARPAFRKAIAD